MNLDELFQIFASEREQLDALGNLPKLEDGETSDSLDRRREIRNDKRKDILSNSVREARLMLSTLEKKQLVILAAHFCSVHYSIKHPTKRQIEVTERIKESQERKRQREEDWWRAGLESQKQTIAQLRTQVEKAKEARRKGADVAHAENRSMKAEVFAWLDTNMVTFRSMDAAAQAIIKVQPIAFRTARTWTGEWKKLRSASRL